MTREIPPNLKNHQTAINHIPDLFSFVLETCNFIRSDAKNPQFIKLINYFGDTICVHLGRIETPIPNAYSLQFLTSLAESAHDLFCGERLHYKNISDFIREVKSGEYFRRPAQPSPANTSGSADGFTIPVNHPSSPLHPSNQSEITHSGSSSFSFSSDFSHSTSIQSLDLSSTTIEPSSPTTMKKRKTLTNNSDSSESAPDSQHPQIHSNSDLPPPPTGRGYLFFPTRWPNPPPPLLLSLYPIHLTRSLKSPWRLTPLSLRLRPAPAPNLFLFSNRIIIAR